jgi:hypothetical protein
VACAISTTRRTSMNEPGGSRPPVGSYRRTRWGKCCPTRSRAVSWSAKAHNPRLSLLQSARCRGWPDCNRHDDGDAAGESIVVWCPPGVSTVNGIVGPGSRSSTPGIELQLTNRLARLSAFPTPAGDGIEPVGDRARRWTCQARGKCLWHAGSLVMRRRCYGRLANLSEKNAKTQRSPSRTLRDLCGLASFSCRYTSREPLLRRLSARQLGWAIRNARPAPAAFWHLPSVSPQPSNVRRSGATAWKHDGFTS